MIIVRLRMETSKGTIFGFGTGATEREAITRFLEIIKDNNSPIVIRSHSLISSRDTSSS